MAYYVIKHQISELADIKEFTDDGYAYNAEVSTEKKPVFTRKL
ncbi:hypothetical protein [Myxosarcina sp. GI1(2024)]